jgi:hypothetical protein
LQVTAIVRRAAAEPGRPAEPRSREAHRLFVAAKLAPRYRVGREHQPHANLELRAGIEPQQIAEQLLLSLPLCTLVGYSLRRGVLRPSDVPR